MTNVQIAVLNRSTVLADAEVQAIVPALQTQVRRDFAPVWGVDADLLFVAQSLEPAPGSWWVAVLDDSDQAAALGYHDLTPEGLPIAKVFANSDLRFGYKWSVTCSHEILEMLVDPDIDLTAFVQSSETTGRLYAYEVADPCEADEYAYKIDDTLVSDFVYPAWFEYFRAPGSTQFDYGNVMGSPFEILPGGYIGVFDVGAGSGWTQITAEGQLHTYVMRPKVGSRRERRRTPRDQWLKSAPQQ